MADYDEGFTAQDFGKLSEREQRQILSEGLFLAGILSSTKSEQRECFHAALEKDPENTNAKRALEMLKDSE